MNQVLEYFQKYIFSALLIIAGLLIVSKGISGAGMTEGNADISWTLFIISGAGLLSGGIISALFIAGLINRMIAMVLLLIFLIGASYLGYANYTSIQDRIALENKYSNIRYSVKQGLIDIRDIQVEYNKIKGEFTNDFDTLINFVRNEQTYTIKRTGTVPEGKIGEEYWNVLGYRKASANFFKNIESWDEDEAVKAGIIKRDTIWKPLMEEIFDKESKSQKDRHYAFVIDSLVSVRNYMNGSLQFKMEADTLGDGTAVFEVVEPAPFHILGKDKDTLKIGSLIEAKTTGNWGEY